jgi:hypothetical protein
VEAPVLNLRQETSGEAIARALLLTVKERSEALDELEKAREDRRAHEQVAEELGELLGLDVDSEQSLPDAVRAVLAERASLREQLDRKPSAMSSCERTLTELAGSRRRALLNIADRIDAYAGSASGIGFAEEAKKLRAIADEARKIP